MRLQTDLFGQFAVHGLFRRLIGLDSALRKLPRILANTSAPKQLVSVITEYYADIRPKSVGVYHGYSGPYYVLVSPFFHTLVDGGKLLIFISYR